MREVLRGMTWNVGSYQWYPPRGGQDGPTSDFELHADNSAVKLSLMTN